MGTERKWKISGQTLYCIAFTIFLIQAFMERMLIGSTILDFSVSKIKWYLRFAAFVILLVKAVAFQRAKIWQWLIAAAMVILGYVTWKTSGIDWMLWMALFIAFGKDVQVKPLAKCTLLVYVPGFILTISLCCAGVLENLTATRANGFMRYGMGFKHPNTFGLFVFMICLSWCVVRFGKKPRSEYAVLAVGALLCYFVANSRTFVVLLLLMEILLPMFYYLPEGKLRLTAKILMFAAGAVSAVISFYFMVFYTETNALHAWCNQLLSSRAYYANLYYEGFSLSWFGVDTGNLLALDAGFRVSSFLVDNAYAHVIIRYGIAATVVFLAGIVLFYADQIRRHRWGICLLGMTLFVVMGLTEDMTLKFQYNYFLIALSGILYGTQTEPDVYEHEERKKVRRRRKRSADRS